MIISSLVFYFVIDQGNGLFLSPMIRDGSIERARNLSIVDPIALGFNITSHSGFITVDEKYDSNLWFWYFPAGKVDPNEAPLILWLQGGPGISGLKGLFQEVGPFSVKDNGTKLIENPFSWHNDHNIIFIDNPVGTGFSFTNHSDGYATNQTQISAQLYNFLKQFLTLFPELKTVPLYLCGQSYGGKHVPSLAYEIHKNNPKSEMKINLKGIAIGNGHYDSITLFEGYAEFLYQLGLIDDQGQEDANKLKNEYKEAIANKNYELAREKMQDFLIGVQYPNLNVYDFTKETEVEFTGPFVEFVNNEQIKKALHAGEAYYTMLSYDVRNKLNDDFNLSGKHWLEISIEHYKTLLYTGQMDIMCAYPMAVNIHRSLRWSGAEQYLNATRYPWYDGKKLIGFSRKVGNMLEVLVRNAGHNVPYDQPERSLILIKSFINDEPLKNEPSKNELSTYKPEEKELLVIGRNKLKINQY